MVQFSALLRMQQALHVHEAGVLRAIWLSGAHEIGQLHPVLSWNNNVTNCCMLRTGV